MSQLIFALCPVDDKTPCPVERTMIQRDELPYFCVFCQIRKRLEKTAEAADWVAWDRYVYGNLKQSQLPSGWKKPKHAARKRKRKKRKVRPKRKAGKKARPKKRGAKRKKVRR